MTNQWNKPVFVEVLQRLQALQLRLQRLQATERLKRATALAQTQIKHSKDSHDRK